VSPLICRSLWGFEGNLSAAISRAQQQGFDGLEVNLRHPALAGLEAAVIREQLQGAGLALILELVSGGAYVPAIGAGPGEQLAELEELLAAAADLAPLRLNLITGSDHWSGPEQHHFLAATLDLVEDSGLVASLETHRSRCLFNPWTIAELLENHPRLRLTADLSHWCVVSERLLTPDLAPVQAMADRVDHIHARIGHAQGPSVGHPFAPEWAEALEAHRRCWSLFRERQRQRGHHNATITPEFGPDGYLPVLPFSSLPVADLDAINQAMATWLRQGVLEG
jgi:hypothetical protein